MQEKSKKTDAEQKKTRKNWFAIFATGASLAITALVWGATLRGYLMGTMSTPSVQMGIGIGVFAAALAGIFFFFIFEVLPQELLRRARDEYAKTLLPQLNAPESSVDLAGFTLGYDRFTMRRFLRRQTIHYAAITQMRAISIELFVNGLRAGIFYQLKVRVPRAFGSAKMKTFTFNTRISRRPRSSATLQAILCIEDKISSILLPAELERWRRGEELNLGCATLTGKMLVFRGRAIALETLHTAALDARRITLMSRVNNLWQQKTIKRKKLWNEQVLLGALRERSVPVDIAENL
jgi:hypothetical protein